MKTAPDEKREITGLRGSGAIKSVGAMLCHVRGFNNRLGLPILCRCAAMTRHTIVRHFDDRKRKLLGKLFQQLGTSNLHEAEATRSRINSLFFDFGKSWVDLIELLGAKSAAVRADLASNIVALGSSDPDERTNARRNLDDLLAQHRKTGTTSLTCCPPDHTSPGPAIPCPMLPTASLLMTNHRAEAATCPPT